MYFNIYLIILFIYFLTKCNCQWSLIWNDEFDGKQLDYSKWSVTDGRDVSKAPMIEEVLSYSRDNNETIKLIDGFLAISAIEKSYQDRRFTTATINSRKNFTYGRIDIRASLPVGKLLKTAVVLLPAKDEYGHGSANGEIDIVTDVQQVTYLSHIMYMNSGFKFHETYPSHNGFQDYSLEWNQTSIIWRLNGISKRIFYFDRILDSHYQKEGQPFDKMFYLSIRLQVFRYIMNNLAISEKYHNHWICPTILIDYVRIYKLADNFTLGSQNFSIKLENSNKTKDLICKSIDQNLSKIYNQFQGDNNLSWKIAVLFCSLIILILLIIMVLYFFNKTREQYKNRAKSENKNCPELYDEIDYDLNSHRLTNTYVPISNQVQSSSCSQEHDV